MMRLVIPIKRPGDRQEKACLPVHPQPPNSSALQFYVVVAVISCGFLASIGIVGFAILLMDSGRLHMIVKVKDLLEMQTEVDKGRPFPADSAR